MDATTGSMSKAPAAADADELHFPFPTYPKPGAAIEVADGIFWISNPVPFSALKQVNCWLLRDGPGWVMVDCGYGRPEVRDNIAAAWNGVLGGRPITRLIITHFHPDHAGNSGWISERWGGLRPLMSQGEWLTANLARLNRETDHIGLRMAFYRRHGLDEARVRKFSAEVLTYDQGVTLPRDYRRLRGGDVVTIGEDRWRVVIGEGHSPEHVSLYCAERRILIAGDQILPAITTNVSAWATEPEFDAVGAFLATCRRFLDLLDPAALILPSHRRPFRNVRHRLHELAAHHAARLNLILDHVSSVTCAGELIDVLFKPGLDGHQIGFAMGEAIAHLNHLVARGLMERIEDRTGVRYRVVRPGERVRPEF
jgi:glyoxylase-like metal-dependent hydrolase (beta-lactamase superfamily II)